MAGSIYYNDKRRTLPQLERTETYSDTINLDSLKEKTKKANDMRPIVMLNEDNLEAKLQKWKSNKTFGLAAEILSQAVVSGKIENVNEVKEYLLSKYKSDTIINWLFDTQTLVTAPEERIKINQEKINLEPSNAIAWADQAINNVLIHDREEAIKCIEKAIKIEKNMGFIVRNASRIFSLTGDTNRAIRVLKDSRYYQFDPQILSAEIAFSQLEDRKTQGIELGKRLINSEKYKNNEKSELASTLGTAEFFKKNYTKSETLFDLALLDPNKNSFAQSFWYKKGGISQQKLDKYTFSNEIQMHKNSKEDNYGKALQYAEKWINDEPYSVRPYRAASHISGVLLGKWDEAFAFEKKALKSQQFIKAEHFTFEDELGFNNDLAYYLLKANKVDEAEHYLEPALELQNKQSKLEVRDLIKIATIGLYGYKTGDIEMGRKLYRRTISAFEKANFPELAASAFLNFFEEEIIVQKNLESIEKLKKELDAIVPKEMDNNELQFRKKRALLLFNNAIMQIK